MRPKIPKRSWLIGGSVSLLAVLFFLLRPQHARAKPGQNSAELPVVAAARVTREDLSRELLIDSEFRPYQEIDLHAKVAGYVQNITVDVGDHVKEGQLIASLELPEVQDDLDRAIATQKRSAEEIKRAEAVYEEAHVAFTRLVATDKAQPHLIAQADLDTAQAKDRTGAATFAAAREQANVAAAETKKLRTMLDYARITAPFSGVVTRRYADKGALIQAGTSSSTQAMPLIKLSQNDLLRLVFPVSVSFVSQIKLGEPVEIKVPALKKTIPAKISRCSGKIDTSTRTMDAEVDIPNADFELIPGMYAAVNIQADRRTNTLTVPIEALSRQKSVSTLFVITPEGTIDERSVQLGLETPAKVEVLSGVQENDLVMIGSRTQVKPGQKVHPKLIDSHPAENL
jgi:RND family efflux transporter MFP subunit